MSLSKYATAGEARAARALVRNILATSEGVTVSVQDGEEWTVTNSRSFDDITGALASTDHDRLLVRDGKGQRLGSFLLVWGNDADGSELIADHSDNAFCGQLAALASA